MSEFFFVFKTMLFSVLLIMGLQLKVGDTTLEERAEALIYESRAGAELQLVADGAVRAGYQGWDWVRKQSDNWTSEKNQERSSRSRSRDNDLE